MHQALQSFNEALILRAILDNGGETESQLKRSENKEKAEEVQNLSYLLIGK